MDLFRIISLETFIDLLHNKREREEYKIKCDGKSHLYECIDKIS